MSFGYSIPDLDIDRINESEDPKRIVSEIQNVINQDSNFKLWPARQWMENFYQYAGLRDIGVRAGSGTVVNNSMMPLVQNAAMASSISRRRVPKVFKAVQIQAANITRRGPTIKCWPVDESEISQRQAKLANIMLDYLWDKDKENDIQHELVLWALLTPLVARKDFLDYSYNKSRIWPKFEQDPNTGLLLQDKPVLDKSGRQILEQYPWNRTEIVPSFRLIVGSSSGRVNDLDFCIDISYKRLGWLRDNFMKNAQGYYADNVEKVTRGAWNFTSLMAYEMAIKQIGFGGNRFYKNGYGLGSIKDEYIHVSCYLPPSKYYNEGHQIEIANGNVVYNGASQSYDDILDVWHPYSFLSYEKVPGRPWGTSYAEKITSIASAYEQARTEFDRLRRTFSVPKLALPQGSQIELDTVTGDEQILRYNAFAPDGGKPQYLNAPQPPNTITEDIKITASDFTEGSGITEILQGRLPPNATTYRQTELLKEEANNAQAPFIRMNEECIQSGQTKKLSNIRKALVYPDKNLSQAIRIFKKQTNYVTDVEIGEFVGQDMLAHVKIEKDSTISKSKLAAQEKYITLAQMGVLGDIVSDPDLNREFKQKMDISGFDSVQNQNVSMAKDENNRMLQADSLGTLVIPPVYEWQDDTIHIRECEAILNDPTLQHKQLVIQSVVQHRAMHQHQQAMKMQQQLMMQQQQAMMHAPLTNDKKSSNLKQPEQRPEEGAQGF